MALSQTSVARTKSFYNMQSQRSSQKCSRSNWMSQTSHTCRKTLSGMQTHRPEMFLPEDNTTPICPWPLHSDNKSRMNDSVIPLWQEQGTLLSPRPSYDSVCNFTTPPSSSAGLWATESSTNRVSIISLLQQQQAVLQHVLDGHRSLEKDQNTIEKKVPDVEHNLQNIIVSSQSSSTSSYTGNWKRKRVVTHEHEWIHMNLNSHEPEWIQLTNWRMSKRNYDNLTRGIGVV